MQRLRAFIFCLLLLTLTSVLSACGGNTGESSSNTTTPTIAPTTTAPATTASQEVRVVMGEMYFKTPITTFKVGQLYKFVLVNEGKAIHEFVIAPPR